jgi:hypothetical protein
MVVMGFVTLNLSYLGEQLPGIILICSGALANDQFTCCES